MPHYRSYTDFPIAELASGIETRVNSLLQLGLAAAVVPQLNGQAVASTDPPPSFVGKQNRRFAGTPPILQGRSPTRRIKLL
jgi:hypothetical protein